MVDTPLDFEGSESHVDLDPDDDEEYYNPTTEDILLFVFRSLTLLIVVVSSIALLILVIIRKRGSWTEVLLFTLIQIIWQALGWYDAHLHSKFTRILSSGTVDSEHARKVFKFFEHLFHGMAVYSGVALVGRLEGLVGVVLWILLGMSVLAPLLFAVVILLMDLTMNTEVRFSDAALIGVAAAKMTWFDLIPMGLLICWLFGQCRGGFLRRERSTRENASKLIATLLLPFHMVHISQFGVYCADKVTDKQYSSVSVWLLEVGYFLAALAIPFGWLVGLLLPRGDALHDQTELNLKLAKQNKTRNIIKYKKPTDKVKEVSSVDTPPNTPYKFKPEVTSSPSATSQEVSASVLLRESDSDKLLTRKDKSKRNSYMEAVSMGSLELESSPPPPKSKSVDPLWLPPIKSVPV